MCISKHCIPPASKITPSQSSIIRTTPITGMFNIKDWRPLGCEYVLLGEWLPALNVLLGEWLPAFPLDCSAFTLTQPTTQHNNPEESSALSHNSQHLKSHTFTLTDILDPPYALNIIHCVSVTGAVPVFRLGSQKFPHILQNLNIHHHVPNCLPLIPILKPD
jgi:hypothetical protein